MHKLFRSRLIVTCGLCLVLNRARTETINWRWQAVMVVMAALPVGINTYLFAERYECGQALAGTAVVLSTAVSVVTLSIVLSVLV